VIPLSGARFAARLVAPLFFCLRIDEIDFDEIAQFSQISTIHRSSCRDSDRGIERAWNEAFDKFLMKW
jgi:hypothetical protein